VNFSSDTSAAAHPSVLKALLEANSGYEGSYGGDTHSAKLRNQLAILFETNDFDFWLCASGTASNALALSIMCSPIGAILCSAEAHIERDERSAPEFFTGGAKLQLLHQSEGKIDENALRKALGSIDRSFVHETTAEALSLTNLTECGTAYTVDEISHYAALAKQQGLRVHLDGARLANALAHTGASPADMSWKAGVDVLTLGLTKTGAMGCEIIILFGKMREELPSLLARAKRSGHMPPKMRYLAAQANALLTDGLWLQLAAHANAMARDLSSRLCTYSDTQLAYPVHGNEVFAHLSENRIQKLNAASAKFYPWPGGSHRFVCTWQTEESEIDAVAAVLE